MPVDVRAVSAMKKRALAGPHTEDIPARIGSQPPEIFAISREFQYRHRWDPSNGSRISCVVCERQAERSEAWNEHPRQLHPQVRLRSYAELPPGDVLTNPIPANLRLVREIDPLRIAGQQMDWYEAPVPGILGIVSVIS
jgi:hypothetical protein